MSCFCVQYWVVHWTGEGLSCPRFKVCLRPAVMSTVVTCCCTCQAQGLATNCSLGSDWLHSSPCTGCLRAQAAACWFSLGLARCSLSAQCFFSWGTFNMIVPAIILWF